MLTDTTMRQAYKKWFDDNFAEYDSIYQAVGLEEPLLNSSIIC